jgi:dTDP-glucose 4,6-dehydratase
VCLDDLSSGRRSNIRHLTDSSRFSFVEACVLDPIDVEGEFEGVVHLASPASPRLYLMKPIFTLRTGAEDAQCAPNSPARNQPVHPGVHQRVYGDR